MTSVLSDTSGDHAIVTETPDGIYYRASALGGCLRALWAARSGQPAAPTPAKMQAVFDRGHEIEPIVINMLKEQGWNIYDKQKEVILPVTFEEFPDTVSQTPPPITKPLFILGHIDALGAPPPGISGPESHPFEHVIEIKGFGPDLWAKYKAGGLRGMFGYSVQTSAYQYAGFADLAFVVYNKETGELDIQFFERPVLERWELDVIVAVVEECSLKLDDVQDFGKHIHADLQCLRQRFLDFKSIHHAAMLARAENTDAKTSQLSGDRT